MFKGKILNAQLLRIIAETGHTDMICVSDAGLPIPRNVERVDLALEKNKPGWLEVCKIMFENMVIEKIYLSEEMIEENPDMYDKFKLLFKDTDIAFIPHAKFKESSKNCRAVVRTGEFSPFCNCILVAGVNF